MEAKEKKVVILYFPSAEDAWPLPENQSFSTHSCCSGREIL